MNTPPENPHTGSNRQALENYAQAFEALTPASIFSELSPLFSEDIFFKDPFNQVSGKPAVLKIFEHMFETLYQPKFVVHHCALSEQTGYLHWGFSFYLSEKEASAGENLKIIDGLSQVTFNETHLINQHIDYWDAGEAVYARVPLLGWVIRKIQRKLSA